MNELKVTSRKSQVEKRIVSVVFLLLAFSFVLLTYSPLKVDAATTIRTATSSTSLVGWWTFDDASGTKATDFSGNNNAGTLYCSGGGCTVPTFIPGKRGTGLDFYSNGTLYGAISLPSSVSTASNNQITVSVWYYNKGGGGDPRIVNRNWCGAGSWLMHRTLGFGVTTASGCAGQRFASFGSMNVGQWYLLTGVFDGSNVYAYRDGILINTTSAAGVDISSNAAGLSVMTNNNGYLDDMRIYNRSLSTSEVSALYRSGQITRKVTNKNSLVGYWSLDDAGGTKATDFSGNGYTGTLTSSPVWTSGKKGGALRFDSTNYVSLPDLRSASYVGGQNGVMVFSAWIKPTSWTPGTYREFANGFPGFLYLGINPSQKLQLMVRNVTDSVNYWPISNSTIPLNQWTHIVFILRGGVGYQFYINGVLDKDVSEPKLGVVNMGSDQTAIGKSYNSDQAVWFIGSVDDVRLYSTLLSADEIKTIYQQNQTLINAPQDNRYTDGLVGYWTFNGKDTETTIADVSGNGFDGYLVGTNNSTSTRKVIGKVGQAFNFGGQTTGGIRIGNDPALNPSRFTISTWVNLNKTNYSYNNMFSSTRDCCSPYNGIQFNFLNTTLIGRITNVSSANQISISTNITTGEWRHVAFSYDGSYSRLYLDGDLIKTQANTLDPGTPATYNAVIGSMGHSNGTYYTLNGSLDEMRLYDHALSDSEVKQLYLLGK
ncbi:MAG: hypothetical protein COV01_02540 [Candidatus Taylorbacteria bacterium CG10_big_fil_rev_8_21_14_0_10_41_48]|uniref:LamG-like jellyroll fold domain-containing protein n=1 Tax=Candidatus Taylorbacteria bacterium CG10_big_fil_rev_8_21_14_0_10_41_48 TaxID=1975024 RepID=A0A2M8LCI7_9BACT|nr:MAG: hypothetical protein COV01_02540 [Candidatus Taylorbacteria bacterium CG10_big_fil_rev_8_21_14_0_10_41_48]